MTPRRMGSIAYLLLVAGLTLSPTARSGTEALQHCLICGRRGGADIVLNVLLFLPLGLLLSDRGRLRALLVSFLLSATIETLQLGIPGRDPSPGDVLFNTLGALAGIALAQVPWSWTRPPRDLGDRMAAVAAVLVALTFPLTAWLAAPQVPEPPYRVEWKSIGSGTMPYPGTILRAGIQPITLREGTVQGPNAGTVRELLQRGALMGAVVEVGPPPPELAPILGLSTVAGETVALLAIDSTDLVFREATRASRLRLDNPELRVRGALDSLKVGETTQLATGLFRERRCFLVRRRMSCGYGLPGDRGWRFLLAFNGAPAAVLTTLSGAWLALLLFPVGYWARWHLALGLGTMVAGYAWLRVPADTHLLPVPPIDLVGIAIGVLAGMLAHRLVSRHGADHG